MVEIKLTREEKINLKEYLFSKLDTLAEYHGDLYPKKNWSLNRLIQTYFYWGDYYNDGYIAEMDYDKDNRLSMYLAQRFKEFMEMPISIRY